MSDKKKEEPLREVQPVVVPMQYFVFGPLAAGFISVFPGMFAFVISNMIARSFDPVIGYGLTIYLISFALAMYLLYLKAFKEPEKTRYRIFENKLEYYEGFFNRQQRTVVFDQVIDVVLKEGVFQQAKSAGSITLVTQQLVSSGDGKLSNRSVVLKNIPNPQEVYDLIRNLAGKG
jgi:uncharacterized membrane protein YdbT with pleckstrin-like domain